MLRLDFSRGIEGGEGWMVGVRWVGEEGWEGGGYAGCCGDGVGVLGWLGIFVWMGRVGSF